MQYKVNSRITDGTVMSGGQIYAVICSLSMGRKTRRSKGTGWEGEERRVKYGHVFPVLRDAGYGEVQLTGGTKPEKAQTFEAVAAPQFCQG